MPVADEPPECEFSDDCHRPGWRQIGRYWLCRAHAVAVAQTVNEFLTYHPEGDKPDAPQ